MRGAFIKALTKLAETDDRIFLLTGDLGYLALEPFIERFPGRFLNMGVAEQNMVGVAAGLAKEGFIPFVYSIVTFAVLRPFEFIRHDIILHRLPVRIVGVGGGLEYAHNGPTHFGLEDVGMMRIQPGMTVIAPADHEQTVNALNATWNLPGPIYYRLGKDDKTVVPGLAGRFELGGAQKIGNGKDLLIITMGSIASEVAKAIDVLSKRGISSTLLIVAGVNPPPANDLKEALSRFGTALTVEAHYVSGGIGSLVSEIVAENKLQCKIIRCGVRQTPDGITGDQDFLYKRYKISCADIVDTVLETLGR